MKNLKFLIFICNFTFYFLFFTFIFKVYAINLDQIKVHFLNGDYKSAILEGEKILANSSQSSISSELYYILGLSYLKDGNFLRASDIFEIILKEFKDTKFKEEARLSLGDTYFLRGDFNQAEQYYKDILSGNDKTKLKAIVYYRLSQVGFKKGDIQQAQEYFNKLKQDYPLSPEFLLNKELGVFAQSALDFYYTVQVGSFSNQANARNLLERLIQKGYPAYIEELGFNGMKSYRVRVGKSRRLEEIVSLERKLSQEGFPTKIFP